LEGSGFKERGLEVSERLTSEGGEEADANHFDDLVDVDSEVQELLNG
jgi:hypothetical protein